MMSPRLGQQGAARAQRAPANRADVERIGSPTEGVSTNRPPRGTHDGEGDRSNQHSAAQRPETIVERPA